MRRASFTLCVPVILGLLLAGCENNIDLVNELEAKNFNLLKEMEEKNQQLESLNNNIKSGNEEINLLKNTNFKLKEENKLLSNTPARQLSEINYLIEKKNEEKARIAIEILEKEFPQSVELERANKILIKLQIGLKEEKELAERKERLGFKVLKESVQFNSEGLSVTASQFKTTNRWVSDSYGDRYHYKDTKRGKQFITARLSITADKNITTLNLPGIAMYEVSGKNLKMLELAEYSFVRWDDYGSYLGNYPDYKNSFMHTATIPFTIAIELDKEKINKPIFMIAINQNCIKNISHRAFINSYCVASIPKEISLDDALSERFFILKSWNKNKI